jgi:iron complex transport system permease protein
MKEIWAYRARWGTITFGLLIGLFLVAALACSIGAVRINPIKTFKIILDALPGIGFKKSWSDTDRAIILGVRAPRVMMGAIVGVALSIAGASFQALLRNPLADPYVLGVSSGGALGAIIAILLGVETILGVSILPLFSFLGAALTMLLVYNIARIGGRLPTYTLLLAGVIVNSFFSAIIMFLISIAELTRARTFQFWTMGDLNLPSGNIAFPATGLIILGAIILYGCARDMNLLALGEESAAQLGVEVERVKLLIFVMASLVTGASVAACGMIGFVGLIIPHITRMVVGADQRVLMPASAFIGASFLVIADTFARTIIAPSEIPIGVVTAICGGPFFVYLLRKQRKPFM